MKRLLLFLILTTSHLFAQYNTSQPLNFLSPDIDYSLGFDWDELSDPMIELNYGYVTFNQKKFNSNFSKTGIAEVKLGFSTVEEYYKKPILEFHDKFLFISFLSAELKSKQENVNSTLLETWRFGFANRDGYGYSAGSISILPYHQDGFVWSFVSSEMSNQILKSDREILDRYEDTFRFGSQAEGGVRIEFSEFVSLNFGYETTVIFPRYLFWKWAGSESIKYIGLGALSYFTDEIIDSTPEAGPIINFLLQNGFAYGFYALQRNKMNWPFSSETPLTLETFKIGMSFTF